MMAAHTGEVLLAAAGLFLGTVGAAALLGAVKWVGKVSAALAKLTEVAEGLATIAADMAEVRSELASHVRQADARWFRLAHGATPVPGPRRAARVVEGEVLP